MSARQQFAEAADQATSFSDFLDRIVNIINASGLMLADIMQTPALLHPGDRLASALMEVAHERSAERAWDRIVALLEGADRSEVLGLATKPEHGKVRTYMHSVFRDLDEYQEEAFQGLAETFGSGVASLLLES
jgi:hypothetical protein